MFKKLAIVFALALPFVFASSEYSFAASRQAIVPKPSPTPEVEIRDVPYEQVNPENGGNYIMKRLKEKIAMTFTFSNKRKADLQKKLVEVRLAELKYIIDKKQMAFFEKATQRYFTTAGQLTDFLVSKKLTSEYGSTKSMLELHIPVLTKLRDTYNPTTAEWRFVEDDINYIKADISKLSQ